MNYSKAFIRFNWITLILIYAIIIAGSFVRITGSGMGCPDWPKCFGCWVPPTSEEQLPEDYKEIYSDNRTKKIEKFAAFLDKMGLSETSEKLRNDPTLKIEQDFNSSKTWTEYANRLVGFLAGNAMLIAFLWILFKYRSRKLILMAGLNLIFMAIEAWFGSIVVASNLTPWTITVHMFLALLIIAIQLLVIHSITDNSKRKIELEKWMKYLFWVCFLIVIYQMFLGTQVREAIDELTKLGFDRETWTEKLGLPFYIHRSFSWLVLILLGWLAWKNYKGSNYPLLKWCFLLLMIELISGVLLAYVNMPGLVQTSHLLFATVLFGMMTTIFFRTRIATQVTQ